MATHAMRGKEIGRATCPICGLIVSTKSHFGVSFKGKKYYFCCNECKSAFRNILSSLSLG